MPKVHHPGDEPIPGYRLTRFLGRGCIGEVWQADTPEGQQVALKLINLESHHDIRDWHALPFLQKVHHPRLVPLLGFWLENQEGELLEGNTQPLAARPREIILALGLAEGNLRDRLAQCQKEKHEGIPTEELLRYMTDAAQGIDFLNQPIHEVGPGVCRPLWHCNIKPQNLLYKEQGAWIGDYGLTCLLEGRVSALTAYSLTYAAPELVRDDKPSPHSDQYALAVTYYELRTSFSPCASKLLLDIFDRKLSNQFDFSRALQREQEILRKATALDPGKRFTSATEFVEQLRWAVSSHIQVPVLLPPLPEEEPEALYEETAQPSPPNPSISPEEESAILASEAPAAGKRRWLLTVLVCMLAVALAVAGSWWFLENYKWGPRAKADQLLAAQQFEQLWNYLPESHLSPTECEELREALLDAWWQQIEELAQQGKLGQAIYLGEQLAARVKGYSDAERQAKNHLDELYARKDEAYKQMWRQIRQADGLLETEPGRAAELYRQALQTADMIQRPGDKLPALLGLARAAARQGNWAGVLISLEVMRGQPEEKAARERHQFLQRALTFLAKGETLPPAQALADLRALLQEKSGEGTWEQVQLFKKLPGTLLWRADELADTDPSAANALLLEAERLGLSASEQQLLNQVKQKIKANKPPDPGLWQEGLAACDRGDYVRCRDICRELRASLLPEKQRSLLLALEVECMILSKETAELPQRTSELKQCLTTQHHGYLHYVAALAEQAGGNVPTAATLLGQVPLEETPELTLQRRERGRELLLQAVRSVKLAEKDWLAPFANATEASQVCAWVCKAAEWTPAAPLPPEVRLARALACGQAVEVEPSAAVTWTGQLLPTTGADQRQPWVRGALLYVRAQAAAREGSPGYTQLALETTRQLAAWLRQEEALRPAPLVYYQRVLQPALRLQERLPAQVESWPAAVRPAVAALQAEVGYLLLENPTLQLPGEDATKVMLDSFQRAVMLAPTEATYAAARAWVWVSDRLPQPNLTAMKEDIDRSLARDAKHPLAWGAMGCLCQQKAQQAPERKDRRDYLGQAIGAYSQAVQVAHQRGDKALQIRFRIACCFALLQVAQWEEEASLDVRKNHIHQALTEAKAALELAPRHLEAQHALGAVLEAQAELAPQTDVNRFREAEAAYTQALEKAPQATFFLARGRCRTKAVPQPAAASEQLLQAESDLRQALRLQPAFREEAAIHRWLAAIALHPSRLQAEEADAHLMRAATLLEKREPVEWVVVLRLGTEAALQQAQRLSGADPTAPEIATWLQRAWERAILLHSSPYSEARGARPLLETMARFAFEHHLAAAKQFAQRGAQAQAQQQLREARKTLERMRQAKIALPTLAVLERRLHQAERQP
jgi:serine/threonine protein kinase